MDTSLIQSFGEMVFSRYSGALIRGVSILGGLYLIFWVFTQPWMAKHRVATVGNQQPKPFKEGLSVLGAYFIYSLFGAISAMYQIKTGHTQIYTNIADYGLAYTILSVPLFLIYTDTTFYWSHLAMHKFKLLYKVHAKHHEFINVTPVGAYAFHWGEAAISALFFSVVTMIIPLHPIPITIAVLIAITYNGIIHLGYDFFPASWRIHPVMKWFNTTSHHIYHHQVRDCNFGNFFTFWDKIMKTERLPVLTEAHRKKLVVEPKS
jgi:lathosterol oxidase